ncbi:unnamed protein product [Cyclocybe aegerita]|uniref:Uncharacterized protein n=1 Tax=Cyclocybe aegerita TaxID=1973307 RepID=A0A8S0W0A0_CYCAE|nr:unnamed protein product [Cyclocybe aegerita]
MLRELSAYYCLQVLLTWVFVIHVWSLRSDYMAYMPPKLLAIIGTLSPHLTGPFGYLKVSCRPLGLVISSSPLTTTPTFCNYHHHRKRHNYHAILPLKLKLYTSRQACIVVGEAGWERDLPPILILLDVWPLQRDVNVSFPAGSMRTLPKTNEAVPEDDMLSPEDQAWGRPPPTNYKWAIPKFARKKTAGKS